MSNGRNICILLSSYEESESLFANYDAKINVEQYLQNDEVHIEFLKKRTAVRQIRDLVKVGKFDIFINLCDGAFDEDRAGIEVIQALESYNAPYSGSDEKFYEQSKDEQKMIFKYYDIPTAPFTVCSTAEDISNVASMLRFPVIVKHVSGYSSIGMTRDSRCATSAELFSEANRFISLFGSVLVEEFIDGAEFTCLVCEDSPDSILTYNPVQCSFPEGESFKHFDLKWCDYEGLEWEPVSDSELAERIREISARAFTACRGVSFGRVDLRMNDKGELYVLEINPQCGIFYEDGSFGSADYCLEFSGGREAFVGFLEHIMEAGWQRFRKRQPVARVDLVRISGRSEEIGFGLIASRIIEIGEVIQKYERQAHHLVTKDYVDSHFSQQELTWFGSYAYPVAKGVYCVWSPEPKDWRPLNHSCEPNCWLSGLDVVAIRKIQKGEQLTIEYGTFCNEEMAPFDCSCGAVSCRGKISGSDFHLDDLKKKYNGHMSPFLI